MSYTKLIYHIVLRTKSSKRTLSLEHSDDLYRYIWGFIQAKDAKLYRINGVEDHIHLCTSIPATETVAHFVQELKSNSSKKLKSMPGFEYFEGWGEGYAAFSCSHHHIDEVVKYIMNQREHHKRHTFREEYEALLAEMGLTLDERHWNA